MAHSSDKFCIIPTEDRRRKLTIEQRRKLLELKGGVSQRKAASMFGVSRRTVQFIWSPEKLTRNKVARAERGGWRRYYNKDDHRESMSGTRSYKKNLASKQPKEAE